MQTTDENIHNGSSHRLYGIQQAMNLPDSEFGDVLDAIFRCLLENLFFLSSCNVVHRNCESNESICHLPFFTKAHYSFQRAPIVNVLVRPGNILCGGKNQRLRLTNFGNVVDLDPPRVGLNNDSLELDAVGSIANTLVADVFSWR